MDKSQSIGLVVLALFLMAYFYFFTPKVTPPETDQQQTEQSQPKTNTTDTTNVIQETVTEPEAVTGMDSVENENLSRKFGKFTSGIEGEEKTFVLENSKIKIEFSNKGGIVKKVTLKEYEDYQYKPLILLDRESSDIQLNINTASGEINLAELYFQSSDNYGHKADTAGISFQLALKDGGTIKQTYYLPENSYQLIQVNDYDKLKGLATDNKITFNWHNNLKKLESDIRYSRSYTTIKYYNPTEGIDDLGERSSDLKEYTFTQPVNWVSFKQRFFVTGLISNSVFKNGYISTVVNPQDSFHIKDAHLSLQIPLDYYDNQNSSYKYYFGPTKLKELKKVTAGFDENLNLGWPVIKWINRYLIITIFNVLEKVIGSYGLIIIILVFIIRLILSPLTYKSQMQMAKTKVLKPELDEIKEKNEGDMQKIQTEQMKLYRQVGVNPLSGCIPMLLQMPILFAMFQFIPHAIELRHESFLWAKDLSLYDSIATLPFNVPFGFGNHVSLFTLLMTFSTILITYTQSQMTATVQGPMKSMQYVMPLIFLFVLNSYPSGLTFYYFVSNLVSFGQMSLMKKFVDEEKIRKILDENKKKNQNKKKSKFQTRLEEAMKASDVAKKKKRK